MATGLIGDAALPLESRGRIIMQDSITESLAKLFSFKFSKVYIPTCVRK
jgi:hypothetical protein